jgi:hypothetical protein
MALKMAQPYKHPKTGVYYFRQRVPTDLRPLLGDKIVSWSLGTKDPNLAKLGNAAAVQEQAMIWERHRKRPEPLPHAQIVALSGLLYRSLMSAMELEPGEPSIWVQLLKLLDRVAASRDGLEKWYGSEADALLLQEGIVTDAYSRNRLLGELDRALRQAAEQQLKRSEGDYGPDPKAERFPALAAVSSVKNKPSTERLTVWALFALWERDHRANGKSARTVGDFRQKIESLVSFLGHDHALEVTPENVADWCEHLRHDEGLAGKTVSQKYLAVAKLVFRLAVEKRKLKVNPTEGLKVRYQKPQRTRSTGYTDDEATIILKAALANSKSLDRWSTENKRAVLWGPWICAFTGARITELMQLRTEDLLIEDINGTSIFERFYLTKGVG